MKNSRTLKFLAKSKILINFAKGGGVMEMQFGSLLNDLASSCYAKKRIVTREVEEGAHILFGCKAWRILVLVRKVIKNEESANPLLLVAVEEAYRVDVPTPFDKIYLWGVDISVKRNEGKVFPIPFLEVGQGIFLTNEIFGEGNRITGLFYEVNSIFMLDSSLKC